MSEAFRLGGWGMYPIAIAGALLVAAAGLYAWQPDRRRLSPVAALGVLTLLVSMLGFVSGVIRSMTAAGALSPNETIGAVIVGIGESMVNLGFGLALLVIATGAVTVGLARRTRAPAAAELIDPLR